MSTPSEREYPPGNWTAAGIADALAERPAEFPVPRYTDGNVWSALANDPAVEPVVDSVVARAEQASENPRPLYPISEYVYHRTEGERGRQEKYKTWDQHVTDISALALAECLEREGRFFDALLDAVWRLCDQSVWLHPANVPNEQKLDGVPRPVSPAERAVALRTPETAHLFGEMAYVFGDRLHPALRERMRTEIDRRVLQPYEARDDFWWFEDPSTTNWNAVCNVGVAHGALYFCEDVDRAARIVAKAADSLGDYLDNFGPDGATAEGVAYWNYGFGNYVQLASTLESRTGGDYSLLSPPIVNEVARYPLKVELSPGRSPAFSDSSERRGVDPYVGCWLGERLDLPALTARGRAAFERHRDRFLTADHQIDRFSEAVRSLLWYVESEPVADQEYPRKREFLSGHEIWVAREGADDGLVVAAKGGHNDEPHNHNDCGSFVVHWRGESQLTDLGGPRYDEYYFTDRRYEYFAARSLGHPVPYVNGYEQAAGEEYAAAVVDRTESASADRVTFDLADCYPDAAGVESLRRTFTLERSGSGRVTVADEATLDSPTADPAFESILVSYSPIERTDGSLRVSGDCGRLTVTPERADVDVTVERLPDAIDKSNDDSFDSDSPDVWRARFGVSGEANPTVTLAVEPE